MLAIEITSKIHLVLRILYEKIMRVSIILIQRHLATEVRVLGQVDLAHPARTERGDDHIWSEKGTTGDSQESKLFSLR